MGEVTRRCGIAAVSIAAVPIVETMVLPYIHRVTRHTSNLPV